MTVVAAGDGREDETGGGGACGALVEKLQHPLANIRARALKNLLFKLRERLVGVAQLEAARKALVPRLLAALREPELELDALHVLELVIAVCINIWVYPVVVWWCCGRCGLSLIARMC